MVYCYCTPIHQSIYNQFIILVFACCCVWSHLFLFKKAFHSPFLELCPPLKDIKLAIKNATWRSILIARVRFPKTEGSQNNWEAKSIRNLVLVRPTSQMNKNDRINKLFAAPNNNTMNRRHEIKGMLMTTFYVNDNEYHHLPHLAFSVS